MIYLDAKSFKSWCGQLSIKPNESIMKLDLNDLICFTFGLVSINHGVLNQSAQTRSEKVS